jgi:HEAT repeat protein
MLAFHRNFAYTALASVLAVASMQAQTDSTAAASTPALASQSTSQRAWSLLEDTVAPAQHTEQRIQALAALGTMGSNDHAEHLIATALHDKDLDIRTAAVLAAGETKNPRLFPDLRKSLDDAEPRVAYTAAVTLWKMHDHIGEDLLMAVANGERRANATLFRGARHDAARTLHSPTALATIGAQESAGLLFGPFGIGIAAIEYARKNGGDEARAVAIDLLAEQHTPAIHDELVDALEDKDPIVRAAATKALGKWPGAATAKTVLPLLDDPKLPVRLTAAATYLRVSSSVHSKPAQH